MSYRDPVTGDLLTRSEHVSWLAQSIIRRWRVLIAITVVTCVCWAVPRWQFDWNLGASYYAIVIESVVGIAMFSQTRRDALILREIRAGIVRMERIEQNTLAALDHLQDEVAELEEKA